MHRLQKPAYNAEEVFVECISTMQGNDLLKYRLDAMRWVVGAAAKEFEELASEARTYTLPHHYDSMISDVTVPQMLSVYEQGMRNRRRGRVIYDRIRSSTETCPLCGEGVVKTLDHYLPKTEYPELAVVPVNLIPACSDCNSAKGSMLPKCAEEQTIHPYFDDFEDDQWLYAELKMEMGAPFLTFGVRAPGKWPSVKIKRAKNHFRTYKLNEIYEIKANKELPSTSRELKPMHEVGGSELVREILLNKEKARSRGNSWQKAMFNALANSAWYCEEVVSRYPTA